MDLRKEWVEKISTDLALRFEGTTRRGTRFLVDDGAITRRGVGGAANCPRGPLACVHDGAAESQSSRAGDAWRIEVCRE